MNWDWDANFSWISTVAFSVHVHVHSNPNSKSPKTAVEVQWKSSSLNMNPHSIFSHDDQFYRPWYSPNASKAENERARRAYEAVLTVTARSSDTTAYSEFSQAVKTVSKEKFNYTYEEEVLNEILKSLISRAVQMPKKVTLQKALADVDVLKKVMSSAHLGISLVVLRPKLALACLCPAMEIGIFGFFHLICISGEHVRRKFSRCCKFESGQIFDPIADFPCSDA